ncbi:S8 family serine peptidase [Halopiger djelfimassiliensis]|uniref:S8 family serine peptidase n=1 Tax=Halopiger djelfimassiliensis TaxID=1293047 RepID=UPI000677B340|nr:S8 family serine peptidase [Halopiger djelfimassiliensis]
MAGCRLPSRSLVVIVSCLLITCTLSPIAVATPYSDGSGAVTDDTPESIVIDDSLPDSGDPIGVVVRLEDPAIDRTDDHDEPVPARLETHADDTQEPVLEYAAATDGITVESELWLTNAVVLEVDPDRVDFETFERFDAVEAVHENFEVDVPAISAGESATTGAIAAGSNRTPEPTTPGVDMVNAPAVWDEYDTCGDGVRVAVLDTGIDADHPDIDLFTDDPTDPTYPGGWAAFDETGGAIHGAVPHDTDGHGTHVSGTVAGGAASGPAIGVAPDVDLLHGRVLDENGGTFAQLVAGMEWALEEDADVLSMSLGSTGAHAQLIEPVRNVRASGVVVVAAVGNEGPETSDSPGNIYESISVGAVTDAGAVAPFSGGERLERSDWRTVPSTWPDSYVVPDVVAPGVAIESAVPGGGYARMPGTSMATPHVTGTAALLLSIDPTASPAEIEAALSETARRPTGEDLEPDSRYGHGIVDANAAADALVADDSGQDSRTVAAETGDESTGSGSGEWSVTDAVFAIALAGLVAALAAAIREWNDSH